MRSLLDVATGMQYLHGLGIVHGDLKAANVLLKSTNTDYRGFTCKCAPVATGASGCASHPRMTLDPALTSLPLTRRTDL